MDLPYSKIPAETKSPNNLILFSKPKVGKTSITAELPDSLLIDLENGSDFVSAVKVKCNTIDDIRELGTEILAAGKPYKYLILDSATALEDLCIPYAETLYSKSSMGANWFTPETGGKAKYGTILNLPSGAGYSWTRLAFEKVIKYINSLAPRVILLGHVKDTLLEKNGAEFNTLDLDLTGKVKRITCSKSDGIGYIYRKNGKNIVSFKTNDEVACGSRSAHLRDQEFVLSEFLEDGTYKTYWEKIFID